MTLLKAQLPERQEHQGANEFLCLSRSSEKFQLFDTQADGERLGDEDDTGEGNALSLAATGFDHQIPIGGDQYAAERGCAVEQVRVGKTVRSVFEGGQHIDPAEPQAMGHGQSYVVVEVERNRRGQIWPRALSLAMTGESPISARSWSTYSSLRARSASISSLWSQ